MSGAGRWLIGAAAVLAALLLLVLAAAVGGTSTSLVPGRPAPDFVITTFDDEVVSLADLRGQVVVLNFWASWCEECEIEAPLLEEIWREYSSRGVTVIGVDYTDTEPAALAFLDKWGVSYRNGPDVGGRISRAYGLSGVPETVVIDRDGLLVALPLAGPDTTGAKAVGPIVENGVLTPANLRSVLEGLTASR